MATIFFLSILLSLGSLASARCNPGFGIVPDTNECVPCIPGFFGAGGNTTCQRCSERIQPLPQQSECIPCPADRPIAINISTVCVKVPSYGEGCPPGFKSFRQSSGCFPCEAGTATLTPSVCEPCPSGTFQSLPEQDVCLPCPEGTRPNEGSTECVNAAGTCAPGSEIGDDGNCQPCRPGFFGLGLGPCEPCPDGSPATVQPEEGQSSCIRCSVVASYAVLGRTQCSPFPEDSPLPEDSPIPEIFPIPEDSPIPEYSPSPVDSSVPENSPVPEDSPISVVFPTPESTLECLPGFGLEVGETECSACKPGFFSVGGNKPCQRCYEGIQPLPQQSECIPCPADRPIAINISTVCVKVPSGGEDCPPGFTAVRKGGGCFPCEAGTATLKPSLCEPCPSGTFQSLPEQDVCLPCPEGTRPNEGSTECVNAAGTCAPGSEIGDDGNCQPCRPGFFGLGLGPCKPCPDGFPATVQPKEGQSSCIRCSLVGPYAVLGRTQCSPFPESDLQLEECPAGFGQGFGEEGCSPCLPGRVSPSGSKGPCTSCEGNTFQGLSGQSECIPCPPNSKPNGIQTCLCERGFVTVTDDNDPNNIRCE